MIRATVSSTVTIRPKAWTSPHATCHIEQEPECSPRQRCIDRIVLRRNIADGFVPVDPSNHLLEKVSNHNDLAARGGELPLLSDAELALVVGSSEDGADNVKFARAHRCEGIPEVSIEAVECLLPGFDTITVGLEDG
jgi:hypothetical protein